MEKILKTKWTKTDQQMEKWDMKNYEMKNEVIDVFQKYHVTDQQWKILNVQKIPSKDFWKIEYFSRYFGWNFGVTTKKYKHKSFFNYVPQKITVNCTHPKNCKNYIPQKILPIVPTQKSTKST